MKTEFYYRILTDTDNNFASDESYFQVNCTGHSFYTGDVRACTSRHDFYLIYLINGTVSVNEPVLEKSLEPGEVIIFQPERHFEYFKPQGVDMEYYWVHFTGYGAPGFLEKCGLKTNRILQAGFHETVCEDFRRLFEVFLSRDKLFQVDSSSKLSAILVDIAKGVSSREAGFSQNQSKISKSISYIHNHIAEALSVDSLAAAEHMSSSHFRAVFREVTGLSPQEYIILSKLNYTCELMRQTDLCIKDIGAAVGYDDPQYFSRIFKKYFDMSPKNYRYRHMGFGGRP